MPDDKALALLTMTSINGGPRTPAKQETAKEQPWNGEQQLYYYMRCLKYMRGSSSAIEFAWSA